MYEQYEDFVESSVESHSIKGQFNGCCPFHDDRHNSFSFNTETGAWSCHAGCGEGYWPEFRKLYEENYPDACAQYSLVKQYIYQDWNGSDALRVNRQENCVGTKKFYQEYFANPGWLPGGYRGENSLAPYLYSKWQNANFDEPIFLVEGEKCADELAQLNLTATTTPNGAKGWHKDFAPAFANRKVFIIPDNDRMGRAYAEAAYADILQVTSRVKIVVLPDLYLKEDIVDWLNRGSCAKDLLELADNTPPTPTWTKYQTEKDVDEKESGGFRLQSIHELYSETTERVEFLVEGLLVEDTVSILPGDPKVGKTIFARQLAACIASGQDFLGRKTKSGPVLYLGLEEIKGQVKKHFQLLGVTKDHPIYSHVGRAPQNVIPELEKLIEEKRPKIVIIDPLILLVKTEDSNAYDSSYRAMEEFIDLARRTRTHILMVHHSNKGAGRGMERSMGSQAFFAAASTSILLLNQNGKRTISVQGRHISEMEKTEFVINENTLTIELGDSMAAASVNSLSNDILVAVRNAQRPLQRSELKESIGGNSEFFDLAFHRVRKEIETGLIPDLFTSGSGKRGNPYRIGKKGFESFCNSKDSDSLHMIDSNPKINYMESESSSVSNEDMGGTF